MRRAKCIYLKQLLKSIIKYFKIRKLHIKNFEFAFLEQIIHSN